MANQISILESNRNVTASHDGPYRINLDSFFKYDYHILIVHVMMLDGCRRSYLFFKDDIEDETSLYFRHGCNTIRWSNNVKYYLHEHK